MGWIIIDSLIIVMRSAQYLVLIIILIITASLIIFNVTMDCRSKQDIRRPRPMAYLTTKLITTRCPELPVAKVEPLGRFGNQLATYANHIALQWEYGNILQSQRRAHYLQLCQCQLPTNEMQGRNTDKKPNHIK